MSADSADFSAPCDGAPPAHAVILAAGKGTRMAEGGTGEVGASRRDDKGGCDANEVLPKVVHSVAGEPMIRWVVRACEQAGVARCVVVVGYRGEMVREVLGDFDLCEFVEQPEQLGTGHATRMAQPLFEDQPEMDVFVLSGDGPLIRPATLNRLQAEHRRTRAAATLATAILENPTGYGRVLRTGAGDFARIVEQKDASPDELAIREVNPSYYCLQARPLFETLGRIDNRNAQGEYYLTDVPALLKERGRTVSVVDAVPPEDVLSINTPEQLATVDAVLRERRKSEVRDQ